MPSEENSPSLKITWGELRELCEKSGVQDNDHIDVIEVAWGSADRLVCEKDEDFGWQVTMKACGE